MNALKRAICMAGMALAAAALAGAGNIIVTTFSESQDNSLGLASGANYNITNGVPDSGNGGTGPNGWPAQGTVSGTATSDYATAQTANLQGSTGGLSIAAANLADGSVHAISQASNAIGFGEATTGISSTARASAYWDELLNFNPLPGNAVGSLVPVKYTIHGDASLLESPAGPDYSYFNFFADVGDVYNAVGAYLDTGGGGSSVNWTGSRSDSGVDPTVLSSRFCAMGAGCSTNYTNGFAGQADGGAVSYVVSGLDGQITVVVQGYVKSGQNFTVDMGVNTDAYGDSASANFGNTGWMTIDTPATWTSQSGVFLTQTYTGAGTPEPATVWCLLSGLAAGAWMRRKSWKIAGHF